MRSQANRIPGETPEKNDSHGRPAGETPTTLMAKGERTPDAIKQESKKSQTKCVSTTLARRPRRRANVVPTPCPSSAETRIVTKTRVAACAYFSSKSQLTPDGIKRTAVVKWHPSICSVLPESPAPSTMCQGQKSQIGVECQCQAEKSPSKKLNQCWINVGTPS